MEILIRKATINDVKELNGYLTKLIRDEKRYDKNINENCIVNSMYDKFIDDWNNCILIAETNDGQPVGYLYGYVVESEDIYCEKITKLDAMFIDEYYRNNGIGEKLIIEFESWSKEKGVKYIELKVLNNNKKAVNLYKRKNFKPLKSIMVLEIKE